MYNTINQPTIKKPPITPSKPKSPLERERGNKSFKYVNGQILLSVNRY